MPLYQYVKEQPNWRPMRKRRSLVLSVVLMGSGMALLLWVVWPILSFITVTSDQYASAPISPIADSDVLLNSGIGTVLAADKESGTGTLVDSTNADAWFPTKPQKKVILPVTRYRLSVPSLKIENALVTIGGNDLRESLIHYGGTAIPGDYGNTVIFGHSTLPQLFDPGNYKTIFSTLPTLVKGNIFIVDYDGIRYTYRIYEMNVRDPSDLSELEQKYDDSYVTLVTCVPPGTYWKRLYVKAILIRP